MLTRQELILQFMLALSANSNVQQQSSYVYQLASNLADEYIKQQA